MAKQVKIKPRPRNTVVGFNSTEDDDDYLDDEATKEPTDNRGVSQANPLLEKAKSPPEWVAGARSWNGAEDRPSRAYNAYRPIVRGTMHARKPAEPVQQGTSEMANTQRGHGIATENDN